MTLEQWAASIGNHGPACGWVLAYLDRMMADYSIPYRELWHSFPVVVGFALLEASAERNGAEGLINWADRAAMRARTAKRAQLERDFSIEQPDGREA